MAEPTDSGAPRRSSDLIRELEQLIEAFGSAHGGAQFGQNLDPLACRQHAAFLREVKEALLVVVPPPSQDPPILKSVFTLDGRTLLAQFYDYEYFERTQKALEAVAPPPSVQEKKCTCWIGRGDEGGWAPDRIACAVHGDKALALRKIQEHLAAVEDSPDWADLAEILDWYKRDVRALLENFTPPAPVEQEEQG